MSSYILPQAERASSAPTAAINSDIKMVLTASSAAGQPWIVAASVIAGLTAMIARRTVST
jgi:hypothetical protein